MISFSAAYVRKHERRIETDIYRLNEHEHYTSPKMCEFTKDGMNFFGMPTGKKEMKENPVKIEITKTWLMRTSVSDKIFYKFC